MDKICITLEVSYYNYPPFSYFRIQYAKDVPGFREQLIYETNAAFGCDKHFFDNRIKFSTDLFSCVCYLGTNINVEVI